MSEELMEIVVKSPAFTEGLPIPVKYTADGEDISPPLTWSGVPHEACSLVLYCDDPDAPHGTWSHWVVYGLPPETRELAEGSSRSTLPAGSVEGPNDFGNPGYGGPSPPPGKPHRYYFKVAALSIELKLPAKAKRDEVLAAMNDHVLAEGWLMGTYGREAD
jgi:Raf kinase inhibitor-like YbhB/YbcL family protein